MKTINGKQWRDALISGVNSLLNHKNELNALNVFPVPDGDTGTNMAAACESGAKKIQDLKDSADIGKVAEDFSKGMLIGARGNSGVVLSQVFRGVAIVFKPKKISDIKNIKDAIISAKEYAYNAVLKPVEGTMLTVIRYAAEALKKMPITDQTEVEAVFEKIIATMSDAVAKTTQMLPVLTEAGVVDSGARGLFYIFEGIAAALRGKPVSRLQEVTPYTTETILVQNEVFDGEFGYCTEFIVMLKNAKNFDKAKFTKQVKKFGTSIIVVHDDDLLKVHIHALRPGLVFDFAQDFGEFMRIKSQNMTLQSEEAANKQAQERQTQREKQGAKNGRRSAPAIISCNVGEGFIKEMQELGVTRIVPTADNGLVAVKDLMKAIREVESDNVFILPNSSNSILAAKQVAQLTEEKTVIVLPSKTQLHGLVAMMFFDAEESTRNNRKFLTEAIKNFRAAKISQSIATGKIGGVKTHIGEYLAIYDRKVVKSTKDPVDAALYIVRKIIDPNVEIVTIYRGLNVDVKVVEKIAASIRARNGKITIEEKYGGQPNDALLIGFE